MLKAYDYECERCDVRFEVLVEADDDVYCGQCEEPAMRLMGAPAIHTLETHMRGYKNDNGVDGHTGQGYWNPGFGEFIDENLTDPKTGAPARYRSLKEKEQLLQKFGKFAKGDAGKPKPRSQRPLYFTKQGAKTSQLV